MAAGQYDLGPHFNKPQPGIKSAVQLLENGRAPASLSPQQQAYLRKTHGPYPRPDDRNTGQGINPPSAHRVQTSITH